MHSMTLRVFHRLVVNCHSQQFTWIGTTFPYYFVPQDTEYYIDYSCCFPPCNYRTDINFSTFVGWQAIKLETVLPPVNNASQMFAAAVLVLLLQRCRLLF